MVMLIDQKYLRRCGHVEGSSYSRGSPRVQFDIPEPQRTACASFLKNFRSIYTLNYELLLYWVILKGARDIHSDGFGLGEEADGFRTFKADAKCSTYYLHGALHLFNNDVLATQKRVVTRSTIIDDIANTIRQTELLPLFVAECTAEKKFRKINSVPYLRRSYESLQAIDGSIFIFGHSAGKSDAHIYEAIFRSRVKKIYFCVHQPENDLAKIKALLAPFIVNSRVEVSYVDAATARVWRV